MSLSEIAGSTVIVTGASRGFGRGTATALAGAGARVVGLARDGDALEKLGGELGDSFIGVRGDATDPELAAELLVRYEPRTVVLNAGANPVTRPIQEQTWDTFRNNWEVDVQQVFNWVRAALRQPLAPGSTVVSFSSAAALRGSPLSGGYAGAKATVRFISAYAAAESQDHKLGIRFLTVLPMLSPATDLGANGAAAYAAAQGITTEAFVRGMGTILTPEKVGEAMVGLAADPGLTHLAYLLMPDGLKPVQ
ncbi:NADP-dependent 3-hydroxy acid dehydrogenase YdfG [Streptomyces sp. DvalAA-14]|uniref:SDR family oxidoreductase n=1 Tax=unclassified Streptomyces TaxID=2593676 RepID=UPI00081B064C|nr:MULTISPECIES: SDR family oxidoreductase [unclassified Streptomyces]MYS23004.1 SDR family NAD(P)-dependent oxidoreductase [Streptomyces sp. SID4948]SCE25832.1 NADP-dependent 3-hydroxy acid dehydrogenase YdfG [Streptomyces sp. DvalAA-14]